jgi:hypothetical protein
MDHLRVLPRAATSSKEREGKFSLFLNLIILIRLGFRGEDDGSEMPGRLRRPKGNIFNPHYIFVK